MLLLRGSFVWVLIVQVVSLHILPPEEAIVYPEFLEERSHNGPRVLKLNDDLTLNLVQKSPFPERLHLRTPQEDGTVLNTYVSSSPYSTKLFQDDSNFASLVVTEDNGLRLHGMIGDDLRIEPLATSERSSDGRVAHRLYKVEEVRSDVPIYQHVSAPVMDRAVRTLGKMVEGRLDKTFARVETHIVIDSVFFEQFKRNKTALLSYLGAAINSVNLRYQTVTLTEIEITVVGFTFYDTDFEEKQFLKFFNVRGARDDEHADISSTLSAFRSFYEINHADLFHKVDLLSFLTGRDMCSAEGSMLNCNTAGIAFVAGVCGIGRTSVVEDKPWSFQVVRNMAHELAHNLGCVHDGGEPYEHMVDHPGAKDCPWNQGYLMSYVTQDNRRFQFSPCCARQMYFVSQLKEKECLFYNSSHAWDVVKTKALPGDTLSLDKLCQDAYAHIKDYHFMYDNGTGLSGSGCKIPCISNKIQVGYNIYWQNGHADGLDGSRCDSRRRWMVCVRGECVQNRPCKECRWRPSQPKAPPTTMRPTYYWQRMSPRRPGK